MTHRRLTRTGATAASGGAALAYDPALRLYQVVAGAGATTRYAYDGDRVASEYNASNALQRRYIFGPGADEPLVWYEGAGTTDRRWLHADERGSVTAISDASGAAIAIDSYDDYGTPATTNLGRFQYTGQAWLPEIGLYSYKARLYNPALGRFMQTDPIGYGDGLNWYNYAHSNPVNNIDPSGTDAQWEWSCYGNCGPGYANTADPNGPSGFYYGHDPDTGAFTGELTNQEAWDYSQSHSSYTQINPDGSRQTEYFSQGGFVLSPNYINIGPTLTLYGSGVSIQSGASASQGLKKDVSVSCGNLNPQSGPVRTATASATAILGAGITGSYGTFYVPSAGYRGSFFSVGGGGGGEIGASGTFGLYRNIDALSGFSLNATGSGGPLAESVGFDSSGNLSNGNFGAGAGFGGAVTATGTRLFSCTKPG